MGAQSTEQASTVEQASTIDFTGSYSLRGRRPTVIVNAHKMLFRK